MSDLYLTLRPSLIFPADQMIGGDALPRNVQAGESLTQCLIHRTEGNKMLNSLGESI